MRRDFDWPITRVISSACGAAHTSLFVGCVMRIVCCSVDVTSLLGSPELFFDVREVDSHASPCTRVVYQGSRPYK